MKEYLIQRGKITMYSPKQTLQINKSFDDVVAAIKNATTNQHPLPIVSLKEQDADTATFSVVRRYANLCQLLLIDVKGSLHREANDTTHIDLTVDVLTVTAILLTAVEVAIAMVVFTLLSKTVGEIAGYVGLVIMVAFLAFEQVRYSWGFRMQMKTFFGEKWWEKTI